MLTGALFENDSSFADTQSEEAVREEGVVQQNATQYLPEQPEEQGVAATLAAKRSEAKSDWSSRGISILGVFALLGIAYLLSVNRRAIKWRIVMVGLSLQLGFAMFILWTPMGKALFAWLNGAVNVLLGFTKAGSTFIFGSFSSGKIEPALANFAFDVLPTIIFFSAFMTVLYHIGIMHFVVRWMAMLMVRLMGTSGAESLSATANIFVGQTEAPLVIRPYVETMTQSELMAVMSCGFATVAGGVMAAYVAMLSPVFPDIAGHLIAASVMSAPAGLVMAKIMVPEQETPKTLGKVSLPKESLDANVIDAAARGAGEGLKLALNVGGMLLAFVALIALINYSVSLPSRIHNESALAAMRDYMNSAMLPVPEGCEQPDSDEAIVACTHRSMVHSASAKGIEIPKELRSLEGELEEQAEQTEALGALLVPQLQALAPLEGSPALRDCEEGSIAACGAILTVSQDERWSTPLESPSFWPFISLEFLFGWLFFPLAWLMGVPWEDCHTVGQLLGIKTVINEFVGYLKLAEVLPDLHYRSVVISVYALCGFSNFSSIAIQIGGISGIAPSRRADLARLGLRAMIAGSLACFLTGNIAGALLV
jgi:CNT family concentrative nucleoside transporter